VPLPALLLATAPLLPSVSPTDPTTPPVVDEVVVDQEIVVEDEMTPAEAREQIAEALEDFGYGEPRNRRNFVVFPSPNGWYPDLRLYPEGALIPHWKPHHKVALVVLGDMHKAKNRRGDIVRAIHPEVSEWREALIRRGMQVRYDALPDELEHAWTVGSPIGASGPLDSFDQRRGAILALWSSRTCTPEGQQVRDIVETFISVVIQTSKWPVTPSELATAQATCLCDDSLQLD
jgi:hypothetical protein